MTPFLSTFFLRKRSFLKMILISLLIFPTAAPASEFDDRYAAMREEEIKAKESKVEQVADRVEVMKKQLETERQATLESQEKIWQDYSQSLELERKKLQDQLSQLDDKQKVFEKELDKRREQDIVRLKDRESEIQRLLAEMERLKVEIRENQKSFEKEVSSGKGYSAGGREQELPSDLKRGGTEILANNSVQVARTPARDFAAGGGFSPRTIYQEYYIEVGDVLDIEVWRVPDLSRSVSVRPDGRISMPVVGDLEVAGLSLVDLRELLTKQFSEYVRNPQVSISIRQFGGRKFAILGQVGSPGIFRFQQDISLLEAIALAGGFREFSRRGKVMVIRGDVRKQPQVKIISANMENVLRKGMLSENITVMPNDIIYVGRDFVGDTKDILDNVVGPFFDTALDYFVLHSASRTDHNS